MVTRLTAEGEGFSLQIPRTLADQLGVGPDTPLELTTDGQRLIVAPVKDPARRDQFDRIVDDMNRRYEKMFKRLAE